MVNILAFPAVYPDRLAPFQAMPGVVYYVDAKSIPAGGKNDWKRFPTPEPVFAAGRSEYAGQAVGLIVAETRHAALSAADAVTITYANQGPVNVDMEAAMEADPVNNVMAMGDPVSYGAVDAAMAAADTVVAGRFRMGSQFHFHMETHVCIARPTEDGLDILVPTQAGQATLFHTPVDRLQRLCHYNEWGKGVIFGLVVFFTRWFSPIPHSPTPKIEKCFAMGILSQIRLHNFKYCLFK